jgi:hypothetical protein
MRNLQPLVAQTLLPGTKEVYGQLLLLDFNQLELQPLRHTVRSFILVFLSLHRLAGQQFGKNTKIKDLTPHIQFFLTMRFDLGTLSFSI